MANKLPSGRPKKNQRREESKERVNIDVRGVLMGREFCHKKYNPP
jgi:hypothetical protein